MYMMVLRALEEASDDEVRRSLGWPAETDMAAARVAAYADICKRLIALNEARALLEKAGLL